MSQAHVASMAMRFSSCVEHKLFLEQAQSAKAGQQTAECEGAGLFAGGPAGR